MLCKNYQTMKHPTSNLQSQQNLVSILLAAGLIVSYNLNTTLADARSAMKGQPSISACPPEILTKAMGTLGLTLTAQGGHKVTVRQNNGSLQAEVHKNLPRIGFLRTLYLPVYIGEGLDVPDIAKLSETTQRKYVAVDFTPDKSHVYIGHRALWGSNVESLQKALNREFLLNLQKILSERSINIDTVDAQGQSALHRAIIQGHTKIAALLLQAGANLKLKDGQNKSPQDYNRELAATAKVMQLLSTLEDLIAANLHGNAQNKDKIEQIGNEISGWFKKLEVSENYTLGHSPDLMYKCNMCLANYYTTIGETLEAEEYEKLATKYKKPATTPDTTILLPPPLEEEAQEALATKITTRPGGASSSTEDAEIQKKLNEISKEALLPTSASDRIEALVGQARQSPSSFAHYISISATRDNLERLMHETIGQPASAQAGAQAEDSNRRHIMHRKQLLARLATLVRSVIDQNRLAFIQNALGCTAQLRDLFFSNLLLTEENIHSRHQELRQEFDPEKAKWIPEARQENAKALMELINNYKDTLLQNLQTAIDETITKDDIQGDDRQKKALQKFRFYQKQGDHFWAMAMDCQHVQEDQWRQITQLGQQNLIPLGETRWILNQLRIEYATHAYEAYRACCRLADEEKPRYLEDQIEFRRKMALCLYTARRYLEAQLYALSAMQLTFDNRQRITLAILHEVQKTLAKVQQQAGGLPKGSAAQIIADSQYSANIKTYLAFGLSLEQPISQDLAAMQQVRIALFIPEDIRSILGAIADDLSKIAKELILKDDHRLVHHVTEEDILKTSKCTVRYKIAGGASMAAGVLGGGFWLIQGVASILRGAGVIAGTTLGGPVVAIVGGIALTGVAISMGRFFWKAGAAIMRKSSIRKSLHGNIQQALTYYDQGHPQQFLETLATEYAPDERLLSKVEFPSYIPADKIIGSLTEQGFSPPGIAYLFNLIGEALSSGKVRIEDYDRYELLSYGKDSFRRSFNEELMKSAAKLDARVAEMRKKDLMSKIKELGRKLSDFFTLRDEGRLAKKYVEDAQKMPFTARLEEMRNIAKLNIAMICLMSDWRTVQGSPGAIDETEKSIKEVRDSMDRYDQCHTAYPLRLPAIEECLWVVTGHTNAIKAPT